MVVQEVTHDLRTAAGETDARQPPRYALRLLGGFGLERGGLPVAVPQGARRLLAFLGVRQRCARAEAAGTLWPGSHEERARANLRTMLWRLHRVTPEPLVAEDDQLALAVGVTSDVAILAAAAAALLAGAPPVGGPVPALATGELLPGWYDDWVLTERERLRQTRLYALEALAERLTAQGRFGEAVQVALTAVQLEPLRESATRVLINVHLAERNINEAVRRLELFRADLGRELGVAPTPWLEHLVRAGKAGATVPLP
ncbi:BTAD domain-containing putative transcriptional regulator [Micromonospora profundi]|uniref:BTAD domain-containing putative transcriptional regulator n=1 Tax=Micromonospora profundi TaxID=1420889 RepID=A0AAJ6L186_9ACTN|nr:BTAD domain-containing putative transcriptional regulator [Micromonospora profundi]WLS44265.1 BTAD domain-containing putative transcriptional regulator [Micromonospora profundi]